MIRRLWFCLITPITLIAQGRGDRPNLELVGRIKTEAFDNSQLRETLVYRSDVYGPRLTGSPEFRQAADWAANRVEGYGIENVDLQKWAPFGRSWSLKQASLEMVEPRYWPLDLAALAWSDSTSGPVIGEAVLTPFGRGRDQQDPKKIKLIWINTSRHGRAS
jgi:hypothetical protein